ncbi:putative disease resistance protein [Vitis vinifera]|uniref:Putative disease resistance protein n=1 Tax=Vitis vinifera TaxID=29760 RepID=A0A438FUG3_VITVI|nr:putative disease resistance protein [Vitis vinifera]
MDHLVPSLEILKCLCQCIEKPIADIYELQEILPSLETEMESLMTVYTSVMEKVEYEEGAGKKRTSVVDDWIKRVKSNGNRSCRFSGRRYKLVKMVRAKRDVVAQKRLEGLELCKGFGEVWTCLEDERVRTIGIYGMGRVGKTTLLKMVNNKFLETNLGFDLVIWAEVSQQARVDELDLSGILGIPIVDCQEKSKVIFTTRFEGVCRGEAALNSHPCILELAEHFVQECSGLPCALITTGKAMAGSTDLNQWEQKLKILKHCPSEFPDKEIFCDELIQLWMGEGFLDEYDDPRAKGEDIIDNLKQACLLEIGSFKKHVKMHRIIRGMALCAMEEVRTPLSFPNLATLFVSNNSMKSFPNGFLEMLEMNDCSHLEGVIVDVENNGGQGFMPQNMVPSKFPLQPYLCTLCELRIFMCPNLLNLTWLIHAPRLLFLDALPFPSLTNISVAFCPSLGKLPFDSKTGNKKSLQKINGEQQWWDALVWEDDNINQILTPYFVPCGDKAPSECATQGADAAAPQFPSLGNKAATIHKQLHQATVLAQVQLVCLGYNKDT